MKPWEEIWRAVSAEQTGSTNELHWGEGQHHCLSWGYDEEDMAAVRLAAAAPEMARLLLSMQWNGDEVRYRCPACGWYGFPRHKEGCELIAVLNKAGVIE